MNGVSVFFDAGAKRVLVRLPVRRSPLERRYLGVIIRDRAGVRLAAMLVQEAGLAAMAAIRHDVWDEGFETEVFELAGDSTAGILAVVAYDPSLALGREAPPRDARGLSALAFGPLVDGTLGRPETVATACVTAETMAPPGLAPALLGPVLRRGFARKNGFKSFSPAIVRAARTADGGRRSGPCADLWPEADLPLEAACEAGIAWRPRAHGPGGSGGGPRDGDFVSAIEERLSRKLAPTAFARLWIGSAADSEALAAGGVSRARLRSAAKLFHLSSTMMRLSHRLDAYRTARNGDPAFLAQSIDPYRADAPYARSFQSWREHPADRLRLDPEGRLYAEARVAAIGLGDLFLLWIDPARLRVTNVTPDAGAGSVQPARPPSGEFWFMAAGQNLAAVGADDAIFKDAAFARCLAEVALRVARCSQIADMRVSHGAVMRAKLAQRLARAAEPAARWAFGGYDTEASDLVSREALAQQARVKFAGRRHKSNGNGAAALAETPPPPALFDAAPEIYLAGGVHGSLSHDELLAASRTNAPLVLAILWPNGDCPSAAGGWLARLAPAGQAQILGKYFDIHAIPRSEHDVLSRLDQLRAGIEALANGLSPPSPSAP